MDADKALNNLLSHLNEQLSSINDASFVAHSICAGCSKPILGTLMEASGKQYHIEHFVCCGCHKSLQGQEYYEPDGAIQCKDCYHKQLPSCAKCGDKILTRAITLSDIHKAWHPEHFSCAICNILLEGKDFYTQNGLPYCARDYHNTFSLSCVECKQQIKGEVVTTPQKLNYHPGCFVCHSPGCGIKLVGLPYYQRNNEVYCETHSRTSPSSSSSSKCPCGNAINGQYVTALGKTWHPEHFVCNNCKKRLVGSVYSEIEGCAYCAACEAKLFPE